MEIRLEKSEINWTNKFLVQKEEKEIWFFIFKDEEFFFLIN